MNAGWLSVGLTVGILCGTIERVESVVFFATGDPSYNRTAPSGALEGSGWSLQGDSFPGVPIAPNFFITATHVGGHAGDTFYFRGVGHVMVRAVVHPVADLTIWEVDGVFPGYADLYTARDEVGKPLVVFGRGTERGEEVRVDGTLKGWLWGKTDGQLRWGENVVAGISDQDGQPADDNTAFQLLRADFNGDGGVNEAHLSGGDSGGSVFIRDASGWKLAGINHAANKDYRYSSAGESFAATLFDESGLFELEMGQWVYHPITGVQPASFYATRISTYVSWILNVVESAGTADLTVALEEAATPLGPYTLVVGAAVDPAARLIRVNRPDGTRFYRVTGEQAHVIENVISVGTQLVFSFQ